MTRRPWFEVYEAAGKLRADRLAGRPVGGAFTIGQGGRATEPIGSGADPHVWVEDWAPLPVDRSVHMRPAETSHPRADSAVARSLRWLLGKAGFGTPTD